MEIIKQKPDMVSPTSLRLSAASERTTNRVLTVRADEDCAFYLFQDFYPEAEPTALAWVEKDGERIGNFFRRIFRRR